MNFSTQFSSLIDNYVQKELESKYHNDEFKESFSECIRGFVLNIFAEIKYKAQTDNTHKHTLNHYMYIPEIKLIDKIFNELYEIKVFDKGNTRSKRVRKNNILLGYRTCQKRKLQWTWKESNPYLYGTKTHSINYEPDCRNVLSTDWNIAQKGQGTDLTIIAEEKRIPAHSQILSCRSEYFRVLLRSKMSESMSREIEIKNHKSAVIENYIKFIYTQELDPKVRESAQLLVDSIVFAHQTLEPKLIQACVSELHLLVHENEVEFDTFKSFIDIALEYEIGSLLDVCFNYIMHHEDILDWLIDIVNIDNWVFLHQSAKLYEFTMITEELETIRKYNQSFKCNRRKVSK